MLASSQAEEYCGNAIGPLDMAFDSAMFVEISVSCPQRVDLQNVPHDVWFGQAVEVAEKTQSDRERV